MRWVVQENLFIENKRQALVHTLDRMGLDYVLVNVLEGGKLDRELPNDGTPIVVNGSVALTRIAQEKGWYPGGFFTDSFDYQTWGVEGSPWYDFLLNKNSRMGKLGEMDIPHDPVFVRPLSDTKAFNGQVMSAEQFAQFQRQSMEGVPGKPSVDTPVLLGKVKTIGQEHRHYIVEGKVITSSRYKLAGRPNFAQGADQAVLDVVQHAIDFWQPAQAFVLDTYISGDEIGIVETGCIGNAGLYEANLPKLVDAIERIELPHKKPGRAPGL